MLTMETPATKPENPGAWPQLIYFVCAGVEVRTPPLVRPFFSDILGTYSTAVFLINCSPRAARRKYQVKQPTWLRNLKVNFAAKSYEIDLSSTGEIVQHSGLAFKFIIDDR